MRDVTLCVRVHVHVHSCVCVYVEWGENPKRRDSEGCVMSHCVFMFLRLRLRLRLRLEWVENAVIRKGA